MRGSFGALEARGCLGQVQSMGARRIDARLGQFVRTTCGPAAARAVFAARGGTGIRLGCPQPGQSRITRLGHWPVPAVAGAAGKSLVSIARTKISTTRAVSAASPGVMAPRGAAVVIVAIAARRNDAVEAKPQRPRIALEGEFDGLPGQCLGLAVEQELGGLGPPVARAYRPAGRIARPAFSEPPRAPRPTRFCRGFTGISILLRPQHPLPSAKGRTM